MWINLPRSFVVSLLIISIAAALFTASVIIYNQATVKAGGPEDPLEAWSESSYVVWQYNSTYYCCRNMSTLLVDNCSSSDDVVIQYPIDILTDNYGGSIYVKYPAYTGTYNANVTLKNGVTLIIEQGALGITVTIDTNATATLLDYANFDFKHWTNGVLDYDYETWHEAETASYVVFKDGNYTRAKNGTTGIVQYEDTNATTVILDAIGTGGVNLFFVSGEYPISGTGVVGIIQLQDDIVIQGNGMTNTWFTSGSAIHQFSLNNTKNVVFKDIGFDGSAQPGDNWNGIIGTGYNVRIERCCFKGFGGKGIMADLINSTILNSVFSDNIQDGIYLRGDSCGTIISYNWIGNNGRFCIGCEGILNCTISHNIITKSGQVTSGKDGINLEGLADGTDDVTDVIVSENHIFQCNGNGIQLLYGATNVKVIGNYLYNNSGHGVRARGETTAPWENLELIGNHVYENGGNGIHVGYQGNNTIISGNIVWSNDNTQGGYSGIVAGGNQNQTNVIITGNIVYDNQASPTQNWGIRVLATVNYYIVTDNIVYDNVSGQIDDSGGGLGSVVDDNVTH